MRRYAGSCRFVYNKALALQQANHEAGEKFIGYVAMAKHLTSWRNGEETPWLKRSPCSSLTASFKGFGQSLPKFLLPNVRISRV